MLLIQELFIQDLSQDKLDLISDVQDNFLEQMQIMIFYAT